MATPTPDTRLQRHPLLPKTHELTIHDSLKSPEQQRSRFALLLLVVFLAFSCREKPRAVIADSSPRRIITLAPNLTEIISAMGCAERLIATDDDSDWPAEVRRLPKVGRGLTPNIERIARLRPDLVVASASADQRVLRAMLGRVNVRLHVERTDRLDDLPAAARRLGRATGCSGAAGWGESFSRQLQEQRRSRRSAPAVLFLAWADPLYVAGSNTFAGDLLAIAGARNAAASVEGWPQYSMEAVAAHPPDVIVFPTGAFTREAFVALMRKHPIWQRLPAVRRDHVLVVDEDTFTHSGPRAIDALEILNRELDRLGYK